MTVATRGSVLVDHVGARDAGMAAALAIGSWLRDRGRVRREQDAGAEVLGRLRASGVVDVVPDRGTVVRGPTARETREAYEIRVELRAPVRS